MSPPPSPAPAPPSTASSLESIKVCAYCGHTSFSFSSVLWPGLIAEWALTREEAEYIDRQQGVSCQGCGNSLRSIALAQAILSAYSRRGTLKSFLHSPLTWMLRVLEINEAGTLSRSLAKLPRHQLGCYPEVDMQNMPYKTDSFDLVVHSDTLEHVPDPLRALSECRRVLKPGGFCCFTIPVITGRLSRSRAGLPPSYHGAEADRLADYRVQTEFGADAWTYLMLAGFNECRLVTVEYPSALAMVARKPFTGTKV